MAEPDKKRKFDAASEAPPPSKKSTGKKQWRRPLAAQGARIEVGDSGIFATCGMKREGKCVAELKDLCHEYATEIYDEEDEDDHQKHGDISAELASELQKMQQSSNDSNQRFTNVKLDVECVVFLKTREPLDPVSFVHRICKDAATSHRKQGRFIQKITPMTLFGKATEKGVDELAEKVLAPHFHGEDCKGKKFAIRPNFRNHTVLKRMDLIKQVAAAVGPGHEVDLKNYDLLILVEVLKNVVGMSVVGSDYDELKRYNLSELQQPTVKPET